jgi:hypothetical protein
VFCVPLDAGSDYFTDKTSATGVMYSLNLTRSTPNSSALDLQNIFRTGRPNLRDIECEGIKCKWAIGAAGWTFKY